MITPWFTENTLCRNSLLVNRYTDSITEVFPPSSNIVTPKNALIYPRKRIYIESQQCNHNAKKWVRSIFKVNNIVIECC